jgi:hypothetical protein
MDKLFEIAIRDQCSDGIIFLLKHHYQNISDKQYNVLFQGALRFDINLVYQINDYHNKPFTNLLLCNNKCTYQITSLDILRNIRSYFGPSLFLNKRLTNISLRDHKILKILLQCKANPNSRLKCFSIKKTCINIAIKNKYIKSIKLLLKYKAEIDKNTIYEMPPDINVLKELVDGNPINSILIRNSNLIRTAIEKNELETLRYLLDLKCSPKYVNKIMIA